MDQLDSLLQRHPDLRDTLIKALKANRFFITISRQERLKPNDPNDLQHFYQQCNYPANHVAESLDHLKRDFLAKNMPVRLADEGGTPGGMF